MMDNRLKAKILFVPKERSLALVVDEATDAIYKLERQQYENELMLVLSELKNDAL